MRAVLLLLAVLPLAWAQFPVACNNDASLTSKTCCPDSCSNRGVCTNITEQVQNAWMVADQTIVGIVCDESRNELDWPLDVRCQWPLRVFEKVCKCNKGWGGYDCSECDFGYIDDGNGGCVKRTTDQLLTRRNFASLTSKQREDYLRVVNRAKNEEEKKWAVVVDEPEDKGGKFELQDVSTYDMLVMHHFLATRETDNKACKDDLSNKDIPNFAHENVNFLTWHRYYLLIVEREFHRIAKSLNINDFALAYWDWSAMGSNEIFKSDLFGDVGMTMPQDVTGDLFDEDWPVLCNLHYQEYLKDQGIMPGISRVCKDVRKLCNISADRVNPVSLQRGEISKKRLFLPTDDSIKMALTAAKYYGDDGFNQRAEGFVELCAGETMPCMYRDEKNTHNNLHNAVHLYIGGHMSDVPTASNDPVFFLHHANVDRMFEAWLQIRNFNGTSPAYGLNDGGHPGHNFRDYLVPFFPLKTNEDMYKRASDLGFRYDTWPWNMVPDSDYGMCSETFQESSKNNECQKVIARETTPTGGGQDNDPTNAGSSNFHISLYLISIAGTCAALIVSKLSNM